MQATKQRQRTPRVAVPAFRPLLLAWHRAHHTELLMRSTGRACFGRRPKVSKIELEVPFKRAGRRRGGTDSASPRLSKLGPTCNATELPGSRATERAVAKYRRRAGRTDHARSRVGRPRGYGLRLGVGWGALAAGAGTGPQECAQEAGNWAGRCSSPRFPGTRVPEFGAAPSQALT